MNTLQLQLLIFRSRVLRLVTFPYRLFKIPSYLREYYAHIDLYKVGDLVRCREQKGGSVKILLAPIVQEKFSSASLGKEVGDMGEKEWLDKEHQKATLSYSFFVARDVWVVDQILKQALGAWIWQKVEGKICNKHPFSFVIRPYILETIVWHEDIGWGKDKMWMDPILVERIP